MAVSPYADAIRARLARGPGTAQDLATQLAISQPTVSRALAGLGDEVVRLGAARSIQYVLRDGLRGLPDVPVYRVDAQGQIHRLGLLVPVRPDGFVMRADSGAAEHTDGLPWWLFDMRPQGYLGQAYALRHGADLGLPDRLSEWTDAQALRALIMHGHDLVGNLLLGDAARERFLSQTMPEALSDESKANARARRQLASSPSSRLGRRPAPDLLMFWSSSVRRWTAR